MSSTVGGDDLANLLVYNSITFGPMDSDTILPKGAKP